MKLSEKIYRIRRARGYTQGQFGSMLGDTASAGISRQSVSSWETGENEPTLDNLRDIAKVLNVSFDVLLDETIDLNDDETMRAVLSGARVVHEDGARSKFAYWIRPYGVKPNHYIGIAVFVAMVAVTIALVPLAFKNGELDTVWFSVFVVMLGLTLGAVAIPISCIKAIATGNPGVSFAGLSPNGLTIHADRKASNTIFIPLKKIERIELCGKQYRNHGSLSIIVKDREKPVVLNNVFKPQETIDIFKKLDSYIEDSDGIKIL